MRAFRQARTGCSMPAASCLFTGCQRGRGFSCSLADRGFSALLAPLLYNKLATVCFWQVLLARGFQFCDEGEPEPPFFPLPTLEVCCFFFL